jgi:hypothetical protein
MTTALFIAADLAFATFLVWILVPEDRARMMRLLRRGGRA